MTANAPSGRVTNRVRCPQIIVVDDQAPHRRFSGHGRGPWAKVDHRDLAEESPDATTFAVPSRMTKRVCVRPPSPTMTSPATYGFSVELFKTASAGDQPMAHAADAESPTIPSRAPSYRQAARLNHVNPRPSCITHAGRRVGAARLPTDIGAWLYRQGGLGSLPTRWGQSLPAPAGSQDGSRRFMCGDG
jgi:hypothetical protein